MNFFTSSFSRPARRMVFATGVGLLLAAGLSLTASAQTRPLKDATAATGAKKSVPDNLTLGLGELVQQYQSALPARTNTLGHEQTMTLLADYPLARTDDQDRVIVDVYLDGSVPLDQAAKDFEALGCSVIAKLDWYRNGVLSLYLPLDQAVTLANTKGVSTVQLSPMPRRHVGKVTSQGTFVHKTESVTSYLGAGVKVGAMSDSYDRLKTTGTGTTAAPLFTPVRAPDDVASGDLPGTGNPNGYTTPVDVVKDRPVTGTNNFTNGSEDEGRGMLQIIHDLAPAASLAFYTAFVSEVDFAAGIIALKNAGCNVICDDVGYFDEPMFSDGPVAQAIDQVVAGGATYFSSAGNDDSSGYTGAFTPVTNNAASQALLTAQGVPYAATTPAAFVTEKGVITEFHSFGTNANGDPILVQNIRIPGTSADAAGTLAFQWDDPYNLLVGGVKQVTTDFDILVFNAAGALQNTRSGLTNNITSNVPLELPGTSLAAATNYKIVLVRTNRSSAVGTGVTANRATQLRYTVSTNDTPVRGDFISYTTSETHGHPEAAGCIGTAAYRYDASPVVDVHDPTHVVRPIVEQFSSNGPVTKYFDSAGNRLATPVQRKTPVLSAVDGVSTTFFPPASVTSGTTPPPVPGPANPSPSDFNGDGYPNFFGTSAAAPQAAGVAAVLISAAKANGLNLSPADVRSLLTSTTQGSSDQTPNAALATAGPTTITANGYARTDNNFFTVAFNGTTGQQLTSLSIDLSAAGIHFDTTTAIPTDASTTATATGVVVSAFNGTTTPTGTTAPSVTSFSTSAGANPTSVLTVNFANFNPGATLKFGVGRRNDGTNIFGQLADSLAAPSAPGNATISAAVSGIGTPYAGSFTNPTSKKWNYKVGYGLIDANAAVNKLLGQ